MLCFERWRGVKNPECSGGCEAITGYLVEQLSWATPAARRLPTLLITPGRRGPFRVPDFSSCVSNYSLKVLTNTAGFWRSLNPLKVTVCWVMPDGCRLKDV